MAKPDIDPVAEALAARPAPRTGHGTLKVIDYYGDRPAVLEQIKIARRDKRMGWDSIAETLTAADPSKPISGSAIQSWCKKQGIT